MSFRENLIYLRSANNMTQEQLAMLLGVSRQSVTKWESGKSNPEMDKLVKMCQIFDCTLDELVQGDLTGRGPSITATPAVSGPPTDVAGYDEFMRKFASKIANGVMAIILGVAICTCFSALGDPESASPIWLPENVADTLAIICLLAGVATGLALLIPAGMEHSQFVKAHPYIQDFYTQDEKAQAHSAFSRELVGGIIAIFIGICIVIAFSETPLEAFGAPSLLVLVAIGVRLIIHGAIMLGRMNIDAYNQKIGEEMSASEIEAADLSPAQKQEALEYRKQDKRIGALCGIIMITATIIALLLLFQPFIPGGETRAYMWFWLPWPIGGLLCGITALAIKGFGKNPDL